MTSPTYPVFEGDGGANTPLRPVAETHLGGLQFQDHPTKPPADKRRMSATDFMQTTMTVERAARMVPALVVDVDGTGTLAISGVICTNDAVTASSVSVTSAATGSYVVTWTAGSLPPRRVRPRVIPQLFAVLSGATQTANSISMSFIDVNGADVATDFIVEVDGE